MTAWHQSPTWTRHRAVYGAEALACVRIVTHAERRVTNVPAAPESTANTTADGNGTVGRGKAALSVALWAQKFDVGRSISTAPTQQAQTTARWRKVQKNEGLEKDWTERDRSSTQRRLMLTLSVETWLWALHMH